MKNNNRKHKLSLSTETVRALDEQQLAGAVGGLATSACPRPTTPLACPLHTRPCPL